MTDETGSVGDAIAAWAAAREAAGEGGHDRPGAAGAPRSVTDGAVVELCEITGETVRAICRLQVAPSQRGLVAPNAVSLAEALFEPKAWYRGVYADDRPVGFVMLYDDREAGRMFLWRLMVADGCQGLGYGWRALELVAEHARTLPGVTALVVSWVPGPGSPEAFYLAFGFEPTGDVEDGEVVGRLRL